MNRWLCLLLIIFSASCNNVATGEGNRMDSIHEAIDSSAIINDSTKLPRDSTSTGVTH